MYVITYPLLDCVRRRVTRDLPRRMYDGATLECQHQPDMGAADRYQEEQTGGEHKARIPEH
jgi:hypothetical protein